MPSPSSPSVPAGNRNPPASVRTFLLILLLSLILPVSLPADDFQPEKQRRSPDYLDPDEARTVQLYRQVLPAVVTVVALQREQNKAGEAGEAERSIGSGVMIEPESHILTSAHLVDNASNIQVKTQAGKFQPVEVVFSEKEADIALLRFIDPSPDLAQAVFGDSDKLAIGQKTYAIGTPYGLENSFSVGHISGFRQFGGLYNDSIVAEYIQTDAAINTGSSGGPLFNSQGEVIGIASHLISSSGGSEGIGLVVAINTIKQLLDVRTRVWLGLEGVYLEKTALQKLFNLDFPGGLLIEQIVPGSPAAEAGLLGGTTQARIGERNFMLGGDLILAYELQSICEGGCLFEAHQLLTENDLIPVRFLRDGKIRNTVLNLGRIRRNFLQKKPIPTP
jgi:serine protease Do